VGGNHPLITFENILIISYFSVSIVGIERGIAGETRYENSVLPNNIPVVTRLFAKATKLSTLKIDSNEISRAYITFTGVAELGYDEMVVGASQITHI
jgi:hypothetical protein